MIKNSLAKSTGFILGSELIGQVLGLVFLVIVTRSLSIEEYACFAVFFVLSGILPYVGGLGMESVAIREGTAALANSDYTKARLYFQKSIRIRLFTSGIFLLLLLIFSQLLAHKLIQTESLLHLIYFMIPGLIISNLYESLRLLANMTQDFKSISKLNVLNNFYMKILVIPFFLIWGLQGYLLAFAGGVCIASFLYFKFLLKRIGWVISEPVKFNTESVSFAFQDLFRYGVMRFDHFSVSAAFSSVELAFYNLARTLTEYINMVTNALVNPFTMKVIENGVESHEVLLERYKKSTRMFILLFLPSTLFIALHSEVMVRVIGGDRYLDAAIFLSILSISLLFNALMNHNKGYLFLQKKGSIFLKTEIASGSATLLIIGLVLLTDLSVVWIPIAKLAGMIIGWIASAYYLKSVFNLPFIPVNLKNLLLLIWIVLISSSSILFELNLFMAIVISVIEGLVLLVGMYFMLSNEEREMIPKIKFLQKFRK